MCRNFSNYCATYNVAFVYADTAGKWPYAEDITADFVYVRLHGAEQLYVSGYTDPELDWWAARIDHWRGGKQPADARLVSRKKAKPGKRDVYVYFDNDAKVHAPFDAKRLATRLGLPSAGHLVTAAARGITCAVERRWNVAKLPETDLRAIQWTEICGLPCIAALLQRKGFSCADDVTAFLRPRLSTLSDPFLLPNLAAAVDRILAAIDRGERIVLFGDYDVDGVTSLALLAEMLGAYGAAPELFLPLRMEEGYGLSRESIERCWEQHHPQLLIAVDCGTSSVAEIAELRRRGTDVIVLDHHEPKSALPECVARR